jgi:hypothetical protein
MRLCHVELEFAIGLTEPLLDAEFRDDRLSPYQAGEQSMHIIDLSALAPYIFGYRQTFPDSDSVILAPGRQTCAVEAEADTPDRAFVFFQSENLLACVCVPDLY